MQAGAGSVDDALVVEHEGLLFPLWSLHVLLAQGAAAEVRRRFERAGSVFETIATDRDFQQAFLASYVGANRAVFAAIQAQMPPGCRRVLDIGCGLGLIDLLLYRAVEHDKPRFYLLDKSVEVASLANSPIAPTGFNELYVFTASLQQSAAFLELNGVAAADIQLCEVGDWQIPSGAPFDLVFSRKSWGFHYPLSEYLDDVALAVAPHGVVITDVRAGTGGEQQLLRRFAEVGVLLKSGKSALVAARHVKRATGV